MKYECNCCNYVTYEKSNYNHHLKTNKHLKNVLDFEKAIENNNNINNNKEFTCKVCNKNFKHQSSQSRHEKTCKQKNKKHVNHNNNFNQESMLVKENHNFDNILKLMEKKTNKQIEEKMEEIKEIKDTVHENTISIQKLAGEAKNFAQLTMSTVGFIIKFLNDAPVIEKDINYLKILQFDKLKLDYKDDEKIVEDLISFRKHGTLVKYLSDIIISLYKKKDPSKQSIWNSDMTRKNYLLRELVNKKPLWITDKGGILTTDIVIHPLLMTIRELMVNYLRKPFISPEQKNMTNEVNKRYFNNDILMDIILEIDDNKLHEDISNYLCPYFHFDKNVYIDKVIEINSNYEKDNE